MAVFFAELEMRVSGDCRKAGKSGFIQKIFSSVRQIKGSKILDAMDEFEKISEENIRQTMLCLLQRCMTFVQFCP